jgi:selenocysteine lyase/cysteine desulfurase
MPSSNSPDTLPPPPVDQFPILDQGLYFNHAAVGPWPRCTAEAVQAFAEENMLRGSAGYRYWYARENELRHRLAELAGAPSPDSIALLKNTTEGICAVAYGLGWQAGDNVVLPIGEFPSNRLPWLAQAVHGVEIREIDIRAADHAESALLDAMDENTRMLSVSAVQWNDGFRLDLHRLGDACRRRDVLFFVDAIQQLGALPMDVEACHIDFLAADAHKWLLAPEGIAVFYCSAPAASSKRFEAGSPNSVGQAALNASAGLLLDYGMENVGARVLSNTDFLLRNLEDVPGIRIRSATAPERRSGIVCFSHQSLPVNDLHHALTRAGVSTVIRDDSIRLSPHFYQCEEQLTEFLNILQATTG